MAPPDRSASRDHERLVEPGKRLDKASCSRPSTRTKTAPDTRRGCATSRVESSDRLPVSERRPASRKSAEHAAPIARKAAVEAPPEAPALIAQFEEVVSRISVRVEEGGYIAEHCSMLVEIARISSSAGCPDALRARAVEVLLRLGRRPESEGPCRRGVHEMLNQCVARGLKP